MLPSILIATAALSSTSLAQHDIPLSHPLQSILSHAGQAPLYTYPTDLTQGIIPKAFHSHNDYWRPLPFYSALSVGAISIEADVWLYNDTLHPILAVLRAQNPDSRFVLDPPTRNGVYDTAAGQTLYLFVDIKTEGERTWPFVVQALRPLREAGYLTAFNGSGVTAGPVTVVGTGNTPLDQIQGIGNATHPRDYFFDAQLAALTTSQSNITSAVSPIASTDFVVQFGTVTNQTFDATQLALLRAQVQAAHDRGIKVRYWDQPGWPVGTRDAVWRLLWDAGVDLLNVDDLEGAAGFWEGDGFGRVG
ncbi:Altered inheritance of mitochondria protein 6 [Teratosphaeria destructans]|uniref:Altered inheritance of mitochondria protein 6 n=1 Tax=Teratosphaeria destructans TaxID=418781 RepID=A0A9W7SUM5_9PEZI|nr:Altered inheritance of mitochondria protein 6 [Teratosphaeria destructans]